MFTEHLLGSDIPYRRAALFVPHSGHWRRRVSSALAARGDYCRVPKKSGADTFPKRQELICRKPLTETPRHGERNTQKTKKGSSSWLLGFFQASKLVVRRLGKPDLCEFQGRPCASTSQTNEGINDDELV